MATRKTTKNKVEEKVAQPTTFTLDHRNKFEAMLTKVYTNQLDRDELGMLYKTYLDASFKSFCGGCGSEIQRAWSRLKTFYNDNKSKFEGND